MQKFTRLFIIFLISLFSYFPISSFSQVVINEVCPANDATIADDVGDYEDWMELYNPTNTIINLKNYKFIYEEPDEATVTWTFPEVLIYPYSHYSIWCSEKDRKDFIDHMEVPVFPNVPWRYTVNYPSSVEPDPNWRNISFNDTGWLQGPGGIGYGYSNGVNDVTLIDTTIFGAPISLYMRQTFFVPDTSKFNIGIVYLDVDDGYVAYLNGVEIGRGNVGSYGVPSAFNEFAYDEHQAVGTGNGSGANWVDKELLHSALLPGNNVFCIQTHNYESFGGMGDMSSYPFFILGAKDTSITFFPFAWDPMQLHPNFSLSNTDGFTISLKDSLGNLMDKQTFLPNCVQPNNSRGRTPDGANTWCLFYFPTPNDTNDVSPCFDSYLPSTSFSVSPSGGFYQTNQTLTITTAPGIVVFYSKNGNNPTPSDIYYQGPIIIDSTQVIRMRAFDTTWTKLMSQTITNTYFINETFSVPVISLALDSLSLWDTLTGIYMMGPNAQPTIPYQNANFWMDWKKQGHTEFFTQNKTLGFEQDCALGIHGNFSRAWPQKSFRVYANDDYMDPYINYKIFPDKNIDKFRSFNIRNAGIDWNTCHFRDRLMHKITQDKTDIDMMDGEPCVLFLNGQYWGVYEMRERQDEYYLAENHNVSPDNVDLLRFEGDILEGSNAAFYDMVQYIGLNDMTMQTNYDSALKLIDLENYCDYFIAETYYNNYDWFWTDLANNTQGTNNIKFWRTIKPASKWRYILWDTDLGMSLFDGTNVNCPNNLFGITTDPIITSPSVHILMFRSMLTNTTFKNYFLNRYCDLMNTIFYPENVIDKVHDIRDELMPEMARQFTIWNTPIPIFGIWTVGRSTDVPSWLAEIDTLEEFVNCRPYYVRDSLQTEFSMVKQVDVTLNVSLAGAGNIKLNTINKLESLPWTGVYFDGNPITMTATPNTGYKFLHWQSSNLISSPNKNSSVTINVTQNETFTAYFEKLELDFSVYPNPFADEFTLTYELTKEMQASVKTFDVLGREVAEIVSEDNLQKEGVYTVNVSADKYPLASGLYFITFTAGEFSKTIKIIRTKDCIPSKSS